MLHNTCACVSEQNKLSQGFHGPFQILSFIKSESNAYMDAIISSLRAVVGALVQSQGRRMCVYQMEAFMLATVVQELAYREKHVDGLSTNEEISKELIDKVGRTENPRRRRHDWQQAGFKEVGLSAKRIMYSTDSATCVRVHVTLYIEASVLLFYEVHSFAHVLSCAYMCIHEHTCHVLSCAYVCKF